MHAGTQWAPGLMEATGGLVGARGGRDLARPCPLVAHGAASVLCAFAEGGRSQACARCMRPGVGAGSQNGEIGPRSYLGSTVELESDLGLPGQAKQVYYNMV